MKIEKTPLAVLLLLLVVACTSTRSRYVIDDDVMEDILYDVHRSHYLLEDDIKRRYDGASQYAMMQHILKQHGVTRQEWDSSLVYYTRHADELSTIYERLTEKMEYEATIMGAGVSEVSDSSDIWTSDRNIILTSEDLFSSYQWKVNTDTTLQAGEKVTLRCMAHFLNADAQKRATLLLALKLSDDSVMTRYSVATQTGIYTTDITDDLAKGIKEVSGIFMLHHPLMSSSATSNDRQIAVISQIKLLHEPKVLPQQDKPKSDVQESDTLRVLNADSLNKKDLEGTSAPKRINAIRKLDNVEELPAPGNVPASRNVNIK